MRKQRLIPFVSVAILATILSTGCAKHVAKVQPPTPPPAPPTPTATLAANPEIIQQGEPTTLTW